MLFHQLQRFLTQKSTALFRTVDNLRKPQEFQHCSHHWMCFGQQDCRLTVYLCTRDVGSRVELAHCVSLTGATRNEVRICSNDLSWAGPVPGVELSIEWSIAARFTELFC